MLSLSRSRSARSSGRLFVYFPGILSDGRESSSEIIRTWQANGDVLIDSYAGDRFNAKEITGQTADYLRSVSSGYRQIVFIGSSMGGLVAYDVYQLLKDRISSTMRFILIDAPTGRGDLQSPLDVISLGSRVWWAGRISNLFSRLYFNLTFVEPKDENMCTNSTPVTPEPTITRCSGSSLGG